ncbi:MAG: hypothetical protein HQK76_09775 [Desulfobacterales bacterium]|nr:hypothetical protein [Desulfobacterales bacterium]
MKSLSIGINSISTGYNMQGITSSVGDNSLPISYQSQGSGGAREVDTVELRVLGDSSNNDAPNGINVKSEKYLRFQEIQRNNVMSNSKAESIENTNETIGLVEKNLNLMKDELNKSVKSFPPFPEGSEERAQQLRGLISIKKQIDSLTIPPPKVDDVYAELQKNLGLKTEIPDLKEDSPDEDIYKAIVAVDSVYEELQNKKLSLYEDIIKTAGSLFPDAKLNEQSAQQKSEDLKTALINGEFNRIATDQRFVFSLVS